MRDKPYTEPTVSEAEIATLQGKLRLVHLEAHLETKKGMALKQVKKYDELRGYKAVIE